MGLEAKYVLALRVLGQRRQYDLCGQRCCCGIRCRPAGQGGTGDSLDPFAYVLLLRRFRVDWLNITLLTDAIMGTYRVPKFRN